MSVGLTSEHKSQLGNVPRNEEDQMIMRENFRNKNMEAQGDLYGWLPNTQLSTQLPLV
jgi:hypothetical protein